MHGRVVVVHDFGEEVGVDVPELFGHLVGDAEEGAVDHVVLPEDDFDGVLLAHEGEVLQELLEAEELAGFGLAGGGVGGAVDVFLVAQGVAAEDKGAAGPAGDFVGVALGPAGEFIVLQHLVGAAGLEHHLAQLLGRRVGSRTRP